jgi:hypothetical protein
MQEENNTEAVITERSLELLFGTNTATGTLTVRNSGFNSGNCTADVTAQKL